MANRGRKKITIREVLGCIGGILAGLIIFFVGGLDHMFNQGPADKALEAEIKMNLHNIESSIQRYSVDQPDWLGSYPTHLFGGSGLYNIGTVNAYQPDGFVTSDVWGQPIHIPQDTLHQPSDGLDYADTTWDTMLDYLYSLYQQDPESRPPVFGDILQTEGYLPKYPHNPFMYKKRKRIRLMDYCSKAALKDNPNPFACYGGEDGYCMFNIGVWGECVQLMAVADGSDQPRLDFPGAFFYQPIWEDGATNYGHLRHMQEQNPGSWLPGDIHPELRPPLDDSAKVTSDQVDGYILCGFGGVKTKGKDLDVSLPGGETPHMFRTGYIVNGEERNPWVQAGDYEGCEDFDERPYADGINDFVVLTLRSETSEEE